ncbi:Retrovirus-related Pol polyprotein from transposon 17.6 [Sesbania bispinosa]|nr:Retrovirus-related Pol polyprotein from transposon 17.6 [Sesbania bispinosa]
MAMKVDSDPFATNASYVEPLEILMVDFEKVGLNDPTDGIIEQFEKEVTPIYLKAGETLIDFLAEKKEKNQEVMLCPRCSTIFDKSAAKAFEESEKKKFQNRKAQNSVGPHRNFRRSFVPRENTPNNQWVGGFQHPRLNQHFGWKPNNGKQVDDKPTALIEDVDSNMITESFESGFPDDLEAICGVVSILPTEVTQQTLGQQEEEDFMDTEFDYGSAPRNSLKKLGKTEADLLPHNIVITDFNWKTSKSEGMIGLNIEVGDFREVEADFTQIKANTWLVEFDKFLKNIAPLRIEDPSSKEEGIYPIYVRLNPESGFVIKYEAKYETTYEEIEE